MCVIRWGCDPEDGLHNFMVIRMYFRTWECIKQVIKGFLNGLQLDYNSTKHVPCVCPCSVFVCL